MRCQFEDPPSPTSPAHTIPASLHRCVLQWRSGSVLDLAQLLAAAPGIKDLVLEGWPGSNRPVVVSAHLSKEETAAALDLLHERLSQGLKLTMEYLPLIPPHDSPPPRSSHGLKLLLHQWDNVLSYDEDECPPSLAESLGQSQPWPLFTDIDLICNSRFLTMLHVAFPNLSSLALAVVQEPHHLAPLTLCWSLRTLEIECRDRMPMQALATAVSSITSLSTFILSPGYHFSERVRLLVTQVLGAASPGLTVVVLKPGHQHHHAS